MSSQSQEDILEIIRQENENKFGILCLNCLIVRTRFKELEDFIESNRIKIPKDKEFTKLDYLDHISIHFYKKYQEIKELQKVFPTCLAFIADMLFKDERIKKYLSRFDFIAKHELIDVFADYCADLGIDVFDTSVINEKKYNCDLYLIKKKPILRTEAVFLRTGSQMTEEEYKEFARGVYTTSGESEWTPTPEAAPEVGPEVLEPEEKEEEIESPPGWPKKVKLPDGSIKTLRSPEEWRKIVREREGRPEPKSEPKHSDEEVKKMIKEDPSHVVTNLMLQRKPEYKHLMYDILKAFVDWVTENDIPVEKGGIMHNEMLYMLDELEREADLMDIEKGVEKTKSELGELEKAVELEEERRAPPTVQSGEVEWK